MDSIDRFGAFVRLKHWKQACAMPAEPQPSGPLSAPSSAPWKSRLNVCRSQRGPRLWCEVRQVGDEFRHAHLSCFGCRTKTMPSAPTETVRSLTVVYEATPSG